MKPENPESEGLIYDYRTGDVINPVTGEVVDRIYVSSILISTDEGLTRVADVTTPDMEIHPLHLPETSYNFLMETIRFFEDIKPELCSYVSKHHLEQTLRLFLRKLSGHKHTKEFMGALLYVSLEKHDVAVDEGVLAGYLGVSVNDLNSEILEVKKLLGIKGMPPWRRTIKLIRYYGIRLNATPEVIDEAVELYLKKPPSKFTPRTVALVTIYLVMKKHGLVNEDEFAELAEELYFSTSIKRVKKVLEKHYGV